MNQVERREQVRSVAYTYIHYNKSLVYINKQRFSGRKISQKISFVILIFVEIYFHYSGFQ
jgi:hypothetical protein